MSEIDFAINVTATRLADIEESINRESRALDQIEVVKEDISKLSRMYARTELLSLLKQFETFKENGGKNESRS